VDVLRVAHHRSHLEIIHIQDPPLVLLVPLAFPLKLLGNFLLKDQSFQGIVTLLLSARQASREASSIILLLVDEAGEASVLTLVILNLDLEILSLLGELLGKCLEFEELCRN